MSLRSSAMAVTSSCSGSLSSPFQASKTAPWPTSHIQYSLHVKVRGLASAFKPSHPGAGAAEQHQELTTRRCRCQASSRSAVGVGAGVGLQLAQATGVTLAATKRPAAARMEAHEGRPRGELRTLLLTSGEFPVQQPSGSRLLLVFDRKSSRQPVVCSNHTGSVAGNRSSPGI